MPLDVSTVHNRQIISALRYFKITRADNDTSVEDANGMPVRWTYTVYEVVKTGRGYSAWTQKSDGGEYAGDGFNFAEDQNTGTGIQGNGVDHDGSNYKTTFNMSPLSIGHIYPGVVISAPFSFNSKNMIELEAWVWGMNGEDGTC